MFSCIRLLYGNLFPPQNKKKKKKNCNFLSLNVFLTTFYLRIANLEILPNKSGNYPFYSLFYLVEETSFHIFHCLYCLFQKDLDFSLLAVLWWSTHVCCSVVWAIGNEIDTSNEIFSITLGRVDRSHVSVQSSFMQCNDSICGALSCKNMLWWNSPLSSGAEPPLIDCYSGSHLVY